MTLETMCRDLIQVPEQVWAAYALSREPLRGKFTLDAYLPYYEEAKRCGYTQADRILASQGAVCCTELARLWGVEIREKPMPHSSGFVIFACYYEGSHIELFRDNAQAAMDLLESSGLSALFGHTDVPELLLAHELFHFLQGREKDLYVNREHIVLWKLWKYARRSRLLSLEEVAAMAFARRILRMDVNPYVFDILMLLPCAPKQAEKLYWTLVTLRDEVTVHELG